MKKTLMSIAGLAMLFISSCNKESSETPQPDGIARNGRPQLVSAARETGEIDSHATPDGGCEGPSIDCAHLEEIIVKPGLFNSLTQAESGGCVVVGEVFSSTEFAEVRAALGNNLGSALASGSYYIKKFYDGPTRVAYFVGATPQLTINNKAFAFQLNK